MSNEYQTSYAFAELPRFLQHQVTAAGAGGHTWVSALPTQIDHLAQLWSFTPLKILHGGSESLILQVQRPDQSMAVLKLGLPGLCDCAREATILRRAQGHGYVRLFAHDQAHNALLMEYVGQPIGESGLSKWQQLEVFCTVLDQAWLPLDATQDLMTGAEKARWLADFIQRLWHELGNPCSPQTIELVQRFALERAAVFDPANSVLVHGDVHAHNVLFSSTEACYKLIDPDGLWAEPALDLGVLIRDWNVGFPADAVLSSSLAACELLAQSTGVLPRAIWQWASLERVSTGLYLLQLGITPEGREMLAIADRWSAAELDWNIFD